jgi:hypothetical protein
VHVAVLLNSAVVCGYEHSPTLSVRNLNCKRQIRSEGEWSDEGHYVLSVGGGPKMSCFEGSQTVPTHLSGRGAFEGG